jgi:hypothetical protein
MRSISRRVTPCIILVFLLLFFITTKEVGIHHMSEFASKPRVLVASSSVICSSEECTEKHWIRRNSFHNWMERGFEVLVLVDHQDDCEKLAETVTCVQHTCWHDSLGLPKVGCLIRDSLETYPEHIVVFTNDDISFQGLDDTIDVLNRMFDQFVAIGRRINVPLDCLLANQTRPVDDTTPLIDIDTIGCEDQRKESDAFELDYFVYKLDASVLDEYPDGFLLGTGTLDNAERFCTCVLKYSHFFKTCSQLEMG